MADLPGLIQVPTRTRAGPRVPADRPHGLRCTWSTSRPILHDIAVIDNELRSYAESLSSDAVMAFNKMDVPEAARGRRLRALAGWTGPTYSSARRDGGDRRPRENGLRDLQRIREDEPLPVAAEDTVPGRAPAGASASNTRMAPGG
jgi:hypothetical protein